MFTPRANFGRGRAATWSLVLLLAGAAVHAADPISIPENFPAIHPRIAIDPSNSQGAVRARVQTDEAAQNALAQLKQRIAAHVERHQTDPAWMVSRLQMYWKSHATEVFIKGAFYDHAGGDRAPVPTVRFSGARDATTNYSAPPLEDVPPEAEDPRGVYLINKNTGKGEWADAAKTGRALESINTNIMSMAQSAATVYWVTGEEAYARFAADLFDAYMLGIYYRKLPHDLNHGHNQTIVGYTTFEVIQEGILSSLATTYDYLHDYLQQRSPEKVPLYAATFKKWIDNTISNGVPFNNWDLIEARFVLNVARVLENNRDYPDGRGAQFYLDQIVNRTSLRQWSLLDLLERGFDASSATWSECPGYSLGVVGDFAGLLTYFDDTFQIDLLPHAPMIGRAVLASAEYLFPNGYVAGWGDSHYSRLSTAAATQLVLNAQRNHKPEQEQVFTRFIKTIERLNGGGRENRGRTEGTGFLSRADFRLNEATPPGEIAEFVSPTFYSAKASWFVQRNGVDSQHGLMISQNGSAGNHMHANGIAMELYGKGLVLGPASGIGTSYFQQDYAEYYSQFPAHNTVVVDGVSSYPAMRSNHPFEVLACYPAPAAKTGHFDRVTFSDLYFLEPETNSDQRRQMSIVRTGTTTGYYVDIFRSKRKNGADKKHEYFYHNLGQELTVAEARGGATLALRPTDKLAFADGDLFAYDYFWDKKSARFTGDFQATFTLRGAAPEPIEMKVWMKGAPGREIFAVKAPPSKAFGRGMISEELAALPLPTLVVQQTGEAWTRPFVAIYESSTPTEPKSIASIVSFVPANASADFVGITVSEISGGTQHIFSATDSSVAVTHAGMRCRATYGVIGEMKGVMNYLFLGSGREIGVSDCSISSSGDPVSAALAKTETGWTFTASAAVTLVLPRAWLGDKFSLEFALNGTMQRISARSPQAGDTRTLSFDLPAMPITALKW